MYSLPSIIRKIMSGRIRWAMHVTHKAKEDIYSILVRKPEENRPVARFTCKWKIILSSIF
jgi:hypothetical protein